MISIAVLGGGLAGCLTALALSQQGRHVTLLEQATVLLNAASLHNEGKLHLSYVYGADPHSQTYKTMIQGYANFFSIIESLTGISQEKLTRSSDFYYGVLPDSLLTVEQINQHFQDVDRHIEAVGLGLGASERCLENEVARYFNPQSLEAVFKTSEFSLDPQHLASIVYAAVMQDSNIQVLTHTCIQKATVEAGQYLIESQSKGQIRQDRFSHVINCLWQQRMHFDRQVGLYENRPYLLRYKAILRFHIPNIQATELKDLVSATYISGPFGDVVNYKNGFLYLSWYPLSKLFESTKDDFSTCEKNIAQLGHQLFIQQSIQALSQFQPALKVLERYKKRAAVSGGYIFAWGKTDIDDPVSELHQRHDIGLNRHGNWLSVDTGKYTTAPLFAMEAAQALNEIIAAKEQLCVTI